MQENVHSQSDGKSVNIPLAIGVMILSGLLRFVPYPIRPPNFGAIGALSLYSGARLPWWIAFFVPLSVMYFTDVLLWRSFLYAPFNWSVYGCYAVTVAVGLLLRDSKSPVKIMSATIGTGAMFYLVTNFCVWFSSRGAPNPTYADSFEGLIFCYVLAIPFHKWTLISDLIFSAVFFGAHAWLTKPVVSSEHVAATR